MYKPAGLINIMKKDANQNDNVSGKLIPKCLVALFLTLNFVFGFDFGFINYFDKKNQKIAQFATLLVNIHVIAMLSLPFSYITIEPVDAAWRLCGLLQYVIDFIVLNCTKYKLYNFLIDVSVIDFGKSNKFVEVNVFCGFIIIAYVFGIQIIKYAIYIYYCKNELIMDPLLLPVHYAFYGIWCNGMDLVSFTLIVIQYYIYHSLKNVNEYVRKVTVNINNVVEQYEAIVDCYDRIMPLYDKIVSIRKFVK